MQNAELAIPGQAMPPSVLNDALSIEEITGQVQLIQQVMSRVMHDGEHFGKVPGCGDKPTLLKPGAEKLAMTFRFAPSLRDPGKGTPGRTPGIPHRRLLAVHHHRPVRR